VRATEKGVPHFTLLAEQTRGVVEVYYATFAAVAGFEGDLTAKALVKAASAQFQRGDLLGEVSRPESVNETTIANAIALLVRRGVLEPAPETPRKGDTAYAQGPSFGDLPALRERLAAALSAR
jgi:glycerol-3-phosphate O-acyltransferase